jgi:membrane-bound lytic murein transglycosylase B
MPVKAVLVGLVASLAALAAHGEGPAEYRAGSERFAAEMIRKHGFSGAELTSLMGDAGYRQEVIDAIRRPWEAKPWYQYRALFLTDKRIDGGVAFWRANADLLERART